MSVYIITARSLSLAKIGYSQTPKVRLAMLQTGSPVDLALEAIIPGSPDNEFELHKVFHNKRARGEWFVLDGAIEALISAFPCAQKLRWSRTCGVRRSRLAEYLDAEGLSAKQIADAVPCAVSTITRAISGQTLPGKAIRKRIHEITSGAVTSADLFAACDEFEAAE